MWSKSTMKTGPSTSGPLGPRPAGFANLFLLIVDVPFHESGRTDKAWM